MTGPPHTPQPGMKDFDKYRKLGAYHWKYVLRHPDYKRRVEAVCERVKRKHTCLDLGCGDGAYMYYVAQKCRHVVGVDGDEAGIRCAGEELNRRQVANYTLVHSTFAELEGRLPRSIRRYDLIYCMDCIEHLFEPREVIDLMRRYLARRGTIILGTPLFVSEEEVSKYHVKEFTAPELDALLLPHFRKIEERYLDAPLPSSQALVKRFYVFYGRRWPWWKFRR